MKRPSWNTVKERIDQVDEAGGLWVKLKDDGDKVVGIFLGDPFPREVHWGGERYEECTGKECEHCKTSKPSLRISINLAMKTEKGWEVKALEQTATFFKDVMKCDEKYGLDAWSFEIERHGAAGDTKTTYSILPEEKLSKDDVKALEALQLLDLAALYKEGAGASDEWAKEKEKDGFEEYAKDEKVPEKVADSIIVVLKELPREATNRFLEKFKIKKVRELRLADKKAAIEFLDALEEEKKKAKADKAEDPFA